MKVNIAMVYEKMGQHQRARQTYDEALPVLQAKKN